MNACKLLISVRSASEALAALEGGASIIDVKEPLHGSLGRSDTATINSVIETVRGRAPVSAALGELAQFTESSPVPYLNFVKWGLAGSDSRWRDKLLESADRWVGVNRNLYPVAVAYVDWQQAHSPPPVEVWGFARDNNWKVLLLDTFRKGSGTLLDWLSLEEIRRMSCQCRDHRIKIALAGSLGKSEINALLPNQPDIFAVRGAVCRGKDRTAQIDPSLVRELSGFLRDANLTIQSGLLQGAGSASIGSSPL
jgi:uncharacterized protein (UPF0264 family)